MGPCWPSKSWKIVIRGESRVWRRVQKRSWEAPGGSVALLERSGKVAGGFGRVPVKFCEVRERPRSAQGGGGSLAAGGFHVP